MNKNIIGLDLGIDQEYLGKVVENVVKSSILSSLGGSDELVNKIVGDLISQKVDSQGRYSNSSYDKDTLLDFYTKKVVKEVTEEEIKIMIDENREKLREVFKKELSKKSTLDKFIQSFLDNTVETLTNSYKTSIDISFTNKKEY